MRQPCVATAFALAVSLPLAALAAEDWEKDFARDMARPESYVRYAAVTRLDPSIPKARDYLFAVLEKQHWYLRDGAIQTLKGASGEGLEELKKSLRKHSSPYVREGIALTFAEMPEPSLAAPLAEALGDKDERVRRAAAMALGNHGAKESVLGLLGAWEKEKQADVAVYYREALEKLSGKYLGSDVEDWKAWWLAVQADWVPPKWKPVVKPGMPGMPGGPGGPGAPPATGEPPAGGEKSEEDKKSEAEGKKTSEETTVCRDVELNFKEAGQGGPLFVLPEYGFGSVYLEKHLLALGDAAHLFYIDLPGVSKFKNLPPGVTGLPEYPVDKLCDAFDELRKLRKQERIAIMGHGMAAWVAMRYATRYPRNVSHLVLVSTWTSGRAWGEGRNRAEQYGKSTQDIEFEHYAQNCLFENGKPRYSPTDEPDQFALFRACWTGYFNDMRNSYAHLFWPQVFRMIEMGGVQIPEFDIGKEKGNPVPTLLIYGTAPRAIWTSAADMRQLAKYYPNAQVIECPNSNRMPMIEDYDRFMKAVKGFFKKFPFKKGSKDS